MMTMKGVKNCKRCLHVVNLNEYTAELKEEKLIPLKLSIEGP